MVVGYGKKIREKVAETTKTKKMRYLCPSCSRRAVKRLSLGTWQCKKCKTKFASGAYEYKSA